MIPILATLTCFGLYLAGYHFYAKYLGRHIFQLDPNVYAYDVSGRKFAIERRDPVHDFVIDARA